MTAAERYEVHIRSDFHYWIWDKLEYRWTGPFHTVRNGKGVKVTKAGRSAVHGS